VLTADTYTSVLHEQHVKAAAATARLVVAAACLAPGTRRRKRPAVGPQKTAAPQPAGCI